MKSLLKVFVLAATLATSSLSFAADRWSSDEMAVRMGVNSWLTLWMRSGSAPGALELKSLYATSPSASLPAAVQAAGQSGSLPSAVGQPERVAVRMEGERAVATFDLDPQQRGSQVVLTWERRAGLWRIVQETMPAISAERVALSEPVRK
jgi:hypothetical protein